MTVEQIAQKLSALSPEKQQEVLDFAEFLQRKSQPKRPWKSLLGALAQRKVDVSEESIAEMRREAWRNFPRDIK